MQCTNIEKQEGKYYFYKNLVNYLVDINLCVRLQFNINFEFCC